MKVTIETEDLEKVIAMMTAAQAIKEEVVPEAKTFKTESRPPKGVKFKKSKSIRVRKGHAVKYKKLLGKTVVDFVRQFPDSKEEDIFNQAIYNMKQHNPTKKMKQRLKHSIRVAIHYIHKKGMGV